MQFLLKIIFELKMRSSINYQFVTLNAFPCRFPNKLFNSLNTKMVHPKKEYVIVVVQVMISLVVLAIYVQFYLVYAQLYLV